MKLDCYSENSGYYHLSDVASSLLFAVVHAVISMVGVVSVGFGLDNYALAADYTVDLGFADFVWKYFETIESERVDGAAGFDEIVVVVGSAIAVVAAVVGKGIVVVVVVVFVVAVGKGIVGVLVAAVVGKGIVVVAAEGKVIVVVDKMIVVVVAAVGKVIVVVVDKMIVVVAAAVGKVIAVVVVAAVGKVIVVVVVVVVGKMIVVVDIDRMAAVALAEQQQNFPLDYMAVVV